MRIGLPIIAAILSACGGAVTTANVIDSANTAEIETQRRTQPKARAAAPVSWNGRYGGDGDGGGGNMEIRTGSGPGRHRVSIDIFGEGGCSGQIEGEGVASGNRLTLTVPVPDNGGQCVITVDRRGSTFVVREEGCLYFHGAQCRFDMTATRARR